MIRCKVQVLVDGKWKTARRLGAYKRVEDARVDMFKTRMKFGKHARILSEFNTVVDATNWELDA